MCHHMSSSPIIVIMLYPHHDHGHDTCVYIIYILYSFIYTGIPKERQLNMLKKIIDTLVQEHHTGRLLPLPQVARSPQDDDLPGTTLAWHLQNYCLKDVCVFRALPFHMSRFKGVVFRSITGLIVEGL